MSSKKKKEFNYLLIPIIFILVVLPLITRLIIYSSGLSQYSWFSDYDVMTDFFVYYKGIAFLILTAISSIILITYMLLPFNKLKSMVLFIPIGIYILFVILSTARSINLSYSVNGGLGHFEGVFVILGYIIMMLYSYQVEKNEKDYKFILKTVIYSCLLMCFIGLLQVVGKDLIMMEWYQKLIIPRAYWKDYLGNLKIFLASHAVSLTLLDPDYAAIYLSMIISFLLVFILPSKTTNCATEKKSNLNNKERIVVTVTLIILTLLLFKTYARTGLVSLFITLLILGYFYKTQIMINWKKLLLIGVFGIIVFVGVDGLNHFRYVEKLIGTVKSLSREKSENPLEEIITNENNISIKYKGKEIAVSITDTDQTLVFQDDKGVNLTENYDRRNKTLNWEHFKDIQIYNENSENTNYILFIINNITWKFYKDNTKGYVFMNDFNKIDKLLKIDRFGFENYEDIASGRGYIWSRSIPLLKNTLFIGSGPDTYPLMFPQTDYVGKVNNCKTRYITIDKPHNFYLLTGIQTGIISLIAWLVFLLLYIIRSWQIYKNNQLSSLRDKMGFGCLLAVISFMSNGFFNDSSLQTSPIFYVLLGLGMDINHQLQKEIS